MRIAKSFSSFALFFLAVFALLADQANAQLRPQATPDSDVIMTFHSARNGEPPSDIVSVAPNTLAVIDHVEGIVLYLDHDAKQLGKDRLPGGFRSYLVFAEANRVILIDTQSKQKIAIPRHSARPSEFPKLKAEAISDAEISSFTPKVVRRHFRYLGLTPPASSPGKAELQIFGTDVNYVTSASYLGADEVGNAYSLSREVRLISVVDDGVERTKVKVRLVVGRHDAKTGRRLEIADLPIDRVYKMPRGSYVTIDKSGVVVAVLPLGAKGPSRGVYLYKPVFKKDGSLNPLARRIAVQPPTAPAGAELLQAARLSATDVIENTDIGVPPTDLEITGQRTRKEMMEVARAFLNFRWAPNEKNLTKDQVFNCNYEAKDKLRSFELPHHLKAASPGKEQVGVPYNWDGKGSLKSIEDELKKGYRAGNICTQYGSKIENTTGIDCSGFVARVWGVSAGGTAHLHKVSDALNSLRLRPGDIFNLAGSHVRIFVSQENNPAAGLLFRTIESVTACGGVCEVSYHAEFFNNYEVRQLKAKLVADRR